MSGIKNFFGRLISRLYTAEDKKVNLIIGQLIQNETQRIKSEKIV